MSALARLERFGEKDPFFKKWRSCRHCLQSKWALTLYLFFSFDQRITTPQLPPEFTYGNLRYIDTARAQPKIAYSPEKTPPKSPITPHFSHAPFIPAQNIVVNPNPIWPQPGQNFEMAEISPPPVATSERKERPSSFLLENLEGSPGNTLRERNR